MAKKEKEVQEILVDQYITNHDVGEIVPRRFLEYAMYVIKDRALPDVRDGLKPVHRRIAYAMGELGIIHNKPYKKCARTVGEVLGKYHPHGDTSVYEAMVILAQDFSTRYPIVDGQGNFGSIDGDSAAAMRYTESRLSKYGNTLLKDLHKNTVDMKPNYDQEEVEPTVLPNLLPNLLVNGSFGIAVGMATKIPSHNIRDIYQACYKIIDNAMEGVETDEDEIIDIVKAPDFATGGTIVGLAGVREAYKTGRGRIVLRSKYTIEENPKGDVIVIHELPYEVNKQKFVESVKELMKDIKNSKGTITQAATFTEIKEIIDESDKEGIRVAIYLKKDENPQRVINNLIKKTNFQKNFNANMIAISNESPVQFTLMGLLQEFILHSSQVITRRSEFDIVKIEERLNIVRGVLKCHGSKETLHDIIEVIRVNTPQIGCDKLIETFGFNKAQVDYIYNMRLATLSNLSRDKYLEEEKSLEEEYNLLYSILNDYTALLTRMKEEFMALEAEFGDDRRTNIELDYVEIEDEDLIKQEDIIVTFTTDNMIKVVSDDEYKTQRRGGKGVRGTQIKDDEQVKTMFATHTKSDLLFFTTEGRCHIIRAHKIPRSNRNNKGKSINNYLNLADGETIVSILAADLRDKDKFLLFITEQGQIKKLALDQLSSRLTVTRVIKFKEGDHLQEALLIAEEDEVLLVTAKGKSVRIATSGEKGIRPSGRAAMGVIGIAVGKNDKVIGMSVVNDEEYILTVTENGFGKLTQCSKWNLKGRATQGSIAHDISSSTGNIVSAITVTQDEDLFIATEQGVITRVECSSIRTCGRSSKGVKVINLNENDKVVSISIN